MGFAVPTYSAAVLVAGVIITAAVVVDASRARGCWEWRYYFARLTSLTAQDMQALSSGITLSLMFCLTDLFDLFLCSAPCRLEPLLLM
jgi:hypothetical protein